VPIRDICVSGNGEPTASPSLGEALQVCADLRRSHTALLGATPLVLITNAVGFLDAGVRDLVARFSRDEGLVVWAKLDAGNQGQFRLMSGTNLELDRVEDGILAFARGSPVVIQTMLCEVGGRSPSDGDIADYAALLSRLAGGGARIDEIHLYTFARPSPGGRCASLGDAELLRQAGFVHGATGLAVRAFDSRAEILVPGAARAEILIPGAARAEIPTEGSGRG
jgi:histidinol dehydrogenase